MSLQGKTILITGSSRGIGEATAVMAGQYGANVVINYLNDQIEAKKTAENVRAAGGKAMLVQADVSQYSQVETMMEQVVAAFGRIDILINNAGILSTKPLIEESASDIDSMISINLTGQIYTAKAVLPIMKQQGGGVIVNVASQAAKETFPGIFLSTYSASKAGVLRFTEVLATEVMEDNIRLYAVLPGGTATAMTGHQGMPAERVGQRIIQAADETLQLKSGEYSEIYS